MNNITKDTIVISVQVGIIHFKLTYLFWIVSKSCELYLILTDA